MLLYALLNDCVTFFRVSIPALEQIRLIINFLPSVVVVVVLIVSALFQCLSFLLKLSSCNGTYLTILLLIVMDSCLSGDVSVLI